MTDQVSINAVARDRALSVVAAMRVQPSALLEYQSSGKVIVIGGEEAMEFAPRLRDINLRAEVLLTSGSVEPGEVVIPAGGRQIAIEGYLGEFTIRLGEQGSSNFEMLHADLVLDLGTEPLFKMPVKPPGYLMADSANEFSLSDALDQLQELTGTFEKPRYFDYDVSICAHGRSGQTGCTRCIDACPTQAITSLAESIEVNPYLCQGGGICAAVCPTGAIRYDYPGASDTLERIQQLLKHYYDEGGHKPVIAFIAESDYEQVDEWPDKFLPVILEDLASVGMEIWLSALAYGASAVVLIEAGSVPAMVEEALMEQIGFTRSLLKGLHYNADVIQYRPVDELASLDIPGMPGISRAGYTGKNEKRRTLYFAIDHLVKNTSNPANEIALPAGAPFGRIHVDDQSCTLCMGCTSVCPSKAVRAGDTAPRLIFVESICVQCGLCQHACPEQAIQLQPRLLTDPEQRRSTVTLHEEPPFNCISCGKPFATLSAINNIMSKLSGHTMFQSDRAKQRLKMCEDCRVIDAVQDVDAMQAALGGVSQDDSARG